MKTSFQVRSTSMLSLKDVSMTMTPPYLFHSMVCNFFITNYQIVGSTYGVSMISPLMLGTKSTLSLLGDSYLDQMRLKTSTLFFTQASTISLCSNEKDSR